MNKKTIYKEIRKISNSSSLPLLIFLVVTLIGSIIINGIVSHSDYDSIWQSGNFAATLRYILVYPILMPVLFAIFYFVRGKKSNLRLKSCFAKPQRKIGWCIKWIIIGIGVSQVIGKLFVLVLSIILNRFGIYPTGSSVAFESNLIGYIMLIVTSVILAPFFEELLFRGIIYRNNEAMGQLFAIIVSGLAFGLWHTNFSQIAHAALSGMFLCFIYLKTKSIIPAMICHLFNNLLVESMTITTSILGTPLESQDIGFKVHYMFSYHPIASSVYLITAFAILVISILGIVLFIRELIKKRKVMQFNKGNFEIGTLRKTAVYFSAPVTLITFLGMIVLTVISAIK